jgi:hypothetical protein
VTRFERPTVELDGEWRFIRDRERLLRPDRLPEGEPILVPACWEAQVARPYGIVTAWYRRAFELPADWAGGRVLLRFGAVMYECAIWLNGRRVGGHEGGYTPFTIEVEDAVRPGGTNELAVRVVNPLNALDEYPAFAGQAIAAAEALEPSLPISEIPHGKQTWYTSTSGIWQSVQIERAPRTYLAGARVTPEVRHERVRIRWALGGGEEAGQPDRGSPGGPGHGIEVVVRDPTGNDVAQRTLVVEPGSREGETELSIPEPRLWDIDAPNLYRLHVRLLRDGEIVDGLVERFGMRTIEARDGKIWLNGRPLYLSGALDQDVYPATLAVPPDRAYLERQMTLAREVGLNLLRCHIKLPDPAYLDAADEAGLLVWCELPSWSRFTTTAAERGRETLLAAVESAWNHPSVVVWSIINEDWGTNLRHEARDRLWLRETVAWLRELDPTRLVVDNSACETQAGPNFHLDTDLADFHIYEGMPDGGRRWRSLIEEFARRPGWLWSPYGDARPRGDEPLVLSEFGAWGLPRVEGFRSREGREPWWFLTGEGICRPGGIARRFHDHGLERIWPDLGALADATQWAQHETLRYQIGELRRHGSIAGHVITELTDAYWEANGLLDVERRPKAYHGRLAELNAPDALFADLPRRDLWSGERLHAEVVLSAWGRPPERDGGRVRWRLVTDGGAESSGELPIDRWPRATSAVVAGLEVDLPDVPVTSDARLEILALDGDGRARARDELRLAVAPSAARRTSEPLDVAVQDPMGIFSIAARLAALGHRVTARPEAALLVTSELRHDDLAWVAAGGRALVLARSADALPAQLGLDRPVSVHPRRLPVPDTVGQHGPWEGDWVTTFSWLMSDVFPHLPRRAPLDLAFAEVAPDHVLLGYDPGRHRAEVSAGMFAGWVHAPAALIWTFPQGRGTLTVTTFGVAPESGPVATIMLDELVSQAAVRRTPPARAEQDVRR